MPPRTDFADLFAIPGAPPPNAIQRQAALETPLETPLEEQLVIIESETGSGKTEAALWRFARMFQAEKVDGLYFALPTRAAASQLHRRVKDFTTRLFPDGDRPAVVLAVPGYDAGPGVGPVALPNYDLDAAGHSESEKPWAAESPKRYLAAQIAVGTVDQAMLGALQVKHAHLRASCLARNLLVVDEVHASDTYMTEIIRALLNAHTGSGGYALLMSATLGSEARQRWRRPGPGPRSLWSATPLTPPFRPNFPWNRRIRAMTGPCSSQSTRLLLCITAGSLGATAGCWIQRWSSGWAKTVTPAGASWSVPRPWSNRWTLTPTF